MKNQHNRYDRAVFVEWNQGPREYQEDYYGIFGEPDRIIMVIADGMGGHSNGDVVSRWTVEDLVGSFKEKKGEAEDIFFAAINRTIQGIKESGKDMGGTVVAAIVEKEADKYKLSYTWMGDSRIYALAGREKPSDNAKKIGELEDKVLWLLTDDDTFVWGFFLNNELTIDQVTQHPNKNQLECTIHSRQTNAGDIAKKRTRTFYLNEGDKLFMCTDGIWETYEKQADILPHLDTNNPHDRISKHLKEALSRGKFNDNGTFIAAEISDRLFDQKNMPGIR
ncbi:MAG: protein phosphatase 2C domain-containing protein, partial [Candidatus Aminicenantes bacterium]|nr:protein phosphatase 2C domain-containing protein [Candidatus Aminicenantes bacterium]